MKRHWIFFLLFTLAFVVPMNAQINVPTKGKKVDAKQKDQIQIDEQLASQFYREQNYEKACELYEKLYEKTNQISHFQQFIECLLHLKEYDKAERELKAFAKKSPVTTELLPTSSMSIPCKAKRTKPKRSSTKC